MCREKKKLRDAHYRDKNPTMRVLKIRSCFTLFFEGYAMLSAEISHFSIFAFIQNLLWRVYPFGRCKEFEFLVSPEIIYQIFKAFQLVEQIARKIIANFDVDYWRISDFFILFAKYKTISYCQGYLFTKNNITIVLLYTKFLN